MPDYRDELGERAYGDSRLGLLLEEIGSLLDADEIPVLDLAGGSYVIWMTPGGG